MPAPSSRTIRSTALKTGAATPYGEYALTDDWTFTAKAESVSYTDFEELDREAFRLTLRRKLLERGNWTVAPKRAPSMAARPPVLPAATVTVSKRAAASAIPAPIKSGQRFYAFADAAYIRQEDGCERMRAEFGYRSDLTGRVFITQQVWVEEGNQSADPVNLESQIGVHFGPVDVSLGYREEYGGQFEESAILVALIARR